MAQSTKGLRMRCSRHEAMRQSLSKPRLHDTTCCQGGCTTRFDNRLNEQSVRSTWLSNRVRQTRLTTGLTTGCIV